MEKYVYIFPVYVKKERVFNNMRALDYILKGMENHISYDELGNVYIYTENLPWSESEKLDNIGVDTTNGDIAYISKED